MKKTFLSALVIVFLLSINSFGQIKFTLNAGMQLPTGNFKDIAKSGYGGNLTLDYSIPLAPVSIAFTAGYDKWDFKDNTLISGFNFHTIPLLAGVRYYTGGPYLGLDLGFAFSNTSLPGSNSTTDFTYSPIVGYRINFSPVGLASLDLNVRYWNVASSGSSTNWIGLNAGLAFGL